MKTLIQYFSKRHLLTNLLFVGVLLAAIGTWFEIGKEEYPDFAMDWVRFSLVYPGATAEDVELFVTKPIEKALKEVSGLYEISADSSSGSANFRITLQADLSRPEEVIQEIKNAVDRSSLPSEVEDPVYRRFSSAEKAIIDIGFYHTEKKLLDDKDRRLLQTYALAFESQILSLPEVSGLDKSGYLKPELQVFVDPSKLSSFDLSMSEVSEQIRNQHIRVPAGNMEDRFESQLSFLSELTRKEDLENTIIRGGFEGQKIRLSQIGRAHEGFEKRNSILKIQGHEGILYNIKKSSSTDILTAREAIGQFVDTFRQTHKDAAIELILIDDESTDIKNRISIIGFNGLGGFVLILLILFVFLDLSSGLWVAAGLPFSLAFTLIWTLLIGYTVNNMTLAGVIIVLGIVVDDAIIVAENVSRLRRQGMPLSEAVVQGTHSVILPVVASVLTTCAAFIPLYSFSGHFGLFVKYIPAIVFLMLAASLFESALILPGHLYQTASWNRKQKKGHWFYAFESIYQKSLNKILRYKFWVLTFFCLLLAGAYWAFDQNMKFVMFPREESREVTVRIQAKEDLTRMEMAKGIEELENMFLQDAGKDGFVNSILSFVGQSRRGGQVRENEATLRIEIASPSDRDLSLKEILEKWESQIKLFSDFAEVTFLKSRWGSDSGSPIEFIVQENDDEKRKFASERAKELMLAHASISNVEIERPITKNEYQLFLNRDKVFTLGINPKNMASSLRAYVEGEILYTLNNGEEEVDVRLTSELGDKTNIDQILGLRSSNENSYLLPYSSLVKVVQKQSPISISRTNYKRTTRILADMAENSTDTPLDIAQFLENQVFPKIKAESPNTNFQFKGEIEDSRESQKDFILAVILSLALIYILLVLLYNSLSVPLLIATIIPFGAVGVIFAFLSHGMSQYGFFAVIGTLGMIGVVVNDSIVMISKLEEERKIDPSHRMTLGQISEICSTRLRAIVVTTLTTVAGLFPTAYGWAGYDSMLAEMMLAMAWGLIFSTLITLIMVPSLYAFYISIAWTWRRG
ncbi:MAG: efflux RND transporter permease subunit [Bdellovibrionales bacterium]|nr:efflux RND transporter permease subunit [Bdellovibrionales bacterium]